MSGMRRYAAAALGAVILAACGGAADTTAEAPTGASPAPAQTAPADGTPATTPEADPAETFAQLAGQGFQASVRVTYEATDEVGRTQSLTFSSDGERSAILFPEGRLIDLGDRLIMCQGEEHCFELPGQGAGQASAMAGIAAPFLGLAAVLEQGAIPGLRFSGERQVAGRSATCATFDPTALPGGDPDAGEATLCVDAQTGVAVLYEVTGPQVTWRMEAVEIGEPRPEDFEPPVPPQQMGGQNAPAPSPY